MRVPITARAGHAERGVGALAAACDRDGRKICVLRTQVVDIMSLRKV
jgi:hypothetical protein